MAAPRRGMGPGARMAAPISRPKDTARTIKRLVLYLKDDVPKLVIVLICVLLNSVSFLAGSYMLRPVVNALSLGIWDRYQLAAHIAKMACVYSVGILSMYMQSRIMITTAQKALKRIRAELFDKISKLPVRYFDKNAHGDIMSRFTNDVDSIGEMMNATVVQLISGIINITGSLILMLYTNWILTLVTLVMVPVMVKAGATVAKKGRRFYKEQQEALGALNGYIEETVAGQKVVKVFCHEDKALEDFNTYNEKLRSRQVASQFFGGVMGPVMNGTGQINYTLTSVVGGLMCVLAGFDIGGMTVFVNYSRQFSRPINELSMQMNTIFSALAGAERVFAVLDETEELPAREGALSIEERDGRWYWSDGRPFKAELVFQNVTFGYDPDKTILKHITLYAKPGQKIAFVGSTGAGKTTITNLVNRFYDIDEGSITIDSVDVRDIDRDSLRRSIAMVLQDTHLFKGTVRENIRYGRPDATDEEVEAAARTASAHSFIMHLEKGYDTVLEGDGANLSQGQRQLLNIARAAISKAPFLILDEATSSVDTRTERQIEMGMDRLMAERTTLVIAHRLSTVRSANAIMVLENGEIIERGDHPDLLAQKGRYYQLYTGLSQLE